MGANLIYLLVGGILVTFLILLVRVWRSLNDKVNVKEFKKRQALLEKEFYDVVLKNKEDIEVLKTESFNKRWFKKKKLY